MHKKEILNNGTRVILTPLNETKAATVLVLFKVGSRYETKNIAGVSHFIEHMMFKGTARRPNTLAISRELDGYGAEFNAYTGKDHTGYYIKIAHEHLAKALDMLSDMLFNSKFDEKELQREKGVIIEEINMYEDNPLMYIEDLFEKTMFHGNTLGEDIAGSRVTVSNMSRKDMLAYKNKYYAPNGTVVCVAGKIDEKALGMVKRYFGAKKRSGAKYIFKKFGKLSGAKISLHYKETEQVHLALGFLGYGYGHKDIYALQVASAILGGSMSSRLFISVRERRGLAYFVRSSVNAYEDTGALMIQAGLDKTKIDGAISLILKECKRIKEKGVTPAELKKAKEYLRGKAILNLEDSSVLADWYAKQEILTEKMLSPEEKFAKIFAVSEDDIKNVLNNVIKESKLRMALIGPFKDKKRFEKLLKI